jgi:hypothetical protein
MSGAILPMQDMAHGLRVSAMDGHSIATIRARG